MSMLYLTGSSGGLGRVIRLHYLDRGWNVAGFDRADDGFKHDNYTFHTIDSSDEASVQVAFKAAGTPTALIATIGGLKPWAAVEDVSIEDFHFVVNLNLLSCFLCMKQAIRLMKSHGGGSIISIGAETALRPEPRKSVYVAAKAAVIALTQAVSLETIEYGINVNCIVPTIIRTKANEEWGMPEEINKWTSPDDIAALCYHLSSASGRAINGAVIRIPNQM